MLDATPLVLVSISAYFLMNVFYEPINNSGAIFRFLFILLTACVGIIVVFAFFRKYQACFTSNQLAGKFLQTIGRRTLDIYLLHYFFIPMQMRSAFTIFSEYNLPLIEFVCSLTVAFLIIAVCLGVSAILRTTTTLGYCLFGAKK